MKSSTQSPGDDLIRCTATALSKRLHSGEISPVDVIEATAARIEEVNPSVNALPILCLEQAHDKARAMTDQTSRAGDKGALWGLPLAVKDYNDLAGVATTYGSPLFAQNIASHSDATVKRLQASGAIAVGKSNVPEWAGAHTFNPVFGHTLNPWNSMVSAGGSSGGAGAALAAGMVALATGNDLGGSLRVPASFNGVVGLRPSPGRVPRGARLPAFDTLWVEGPMGRCVADVALMLDGGAGFDPVDPLSFPHHGESFVDALSRSELPKRVAFSPDLGVVPMEDEISSLCGEAAERFRDIGTEVSHLSPDFSGAIESFQTLRGVLIAQMMESILAEHRDQIAPEIIWNIEKGLAVTNSELLAAERVRSGLYREMEKFFGEYDLLLCPAVSVPPFPKSQRYVETINGQPTQTYIDWIAITFAITMTSCPALSLPIGFTQAGLPVGLQVVGPPRGEAALLRAAHRMEAVFDLVGALPIDPR